VAPQHGPHVYETDIPGVTLRSDVRLPTGKGYPPHIVHTRAWNWGEGGWHVECSVCGRYTGRTKNRGTLAIFLRTHRRCSPLRHDDRA
jgi:hypothetical protein